MSIKVAVVKNYLDKESCEQLNQWVLDAIAQNKIGLGITIPKEGHYSSFERITSEKRYTSRIYSDNYEYPELVTSIFDRIKTELNLKNAIVSTNGGKDGVVVSCTYPDGDVYLHKDPKEGPGVSLLRVNILSKAAQTGGAIHVKDAIFNLEQGDMMAYLVDEYEHCVEPVEGDEPRIMWMFGLLLPKHLWEANIVGGNLNNEYRINK
ncbi:hypothetical protein UFOVP285_19 [uncultured Caudovirales phage]|uniref:Uncharacterized protein n=1 Tax=uncultured Caudovirales phage TaxID=2100421 RepID=A0A6J5LUM0_9CAUD|nr:hypothetical protein UFOVP285_19 [uncultured Caudovirales phage]